MVSRLDKNGFVVGLRGISGVGKTYLMNKVIERGIYTPDRKSLYPVLPVSFSGPLKRGLETMGITKKDFPVLFRQAAQILGTEVVRRYIPDFWVQRFAEEIESLDMIYRYSYPRRPFIVISDDVRFRNEAAVCNLTIYIRANPPVVPLHHRLEYYRLKPWRSAPLGIFYPWRPHESERWALAGPERNESVVVSDRMDLGASATKHMASLIEAAVHRHKLPEPEDSDDPEVAQEQVVSLDHTGTESKGAGHTEAQ